MAAQDIITEHLDIWTSAVKTKSASGRGSSKKLDLYGIKKLRELILELAVRGKLVPQDPNDEPASELLKEVLQEKADLTKEKKIKKTKRLDEINTDDFPFELPLGWEFARLNDFGDWGAGSTPTRSNTDFYGGNIPWFKSGELNSEFISESEEYITELALQKSSVRYNKVGDVLVAMYGATIGKCSILAIRGTTNQAVCACTPFSKIFNRYLLLILKGYKNRLIGMGAGGAQPNISREKLISTVAPLPPLNEQHSIVAKVDELMALCDQLETQTESSIQAHQTIVETLLVTLTNAKDADEFNESWQRISQHFDVLFTTEASIDQLKQTILQLAVMGKLVKQDPDDEPASKLLERIATEKQQLIKGGKIKKQKPLPPITDDDKPFELPNGWAWCALAELITIMDAGWSPACPPEPSLNEKTWGVLKTTAVQSMEFREYENKMLPSNKEPKLQYEVKVGDILITRAGPKNRVGVSCLVQETRPRLMISDKLIRFHLIEVGLSERFISLCLNAGATAEYLEFAKSGMAESQMNISQDKLKGAPVPLCPLNEQSRVISKVDQLMSLCDSLKESLNEAQNTQFHLSDAIVEQAI
ncbi:restriction endonuclease subunit S [Aliiglaciecola sp. NS0011-25]|uniref:restriction endonuclease subunit S n=1 Tax=Aliiglaciecola sp. NS0011-25 TaxID=3127654 RepID=UPI003101C04B